MATPTAIVAYLGLFAGIAVLFLFVNLVVGRFVRPQLPNEEKLEIYECGEPTIGSSFVQFDLRFYVVALLFIIFDVEVAFFFPWAAVYGGAMQLADTRLSDQAREDLSARLLDIAPSQMVPANVISAESAMKLGWTGFADLLVFFGVLLVGFAYVWKRGDLDWIRALVRKSAQAADQTGGLKPQVTVSGQ